MRQIPIAEFKAMVNSLADQYPNCVVDFVYPKSHGNRQRSAIGTMTQYSMLIRSHDVGGGTLRIYINWARDEPVKLENPP